VEQDECIFVTEANQKLYHSRMFIERPIECMIVHGMFDNLVVMQLHHGRLGNDAMPQACLERAILYQSDERQLGDRRL
jgi:hypothetical protein